jgi:hypothetical protein
LRGPQLAQAGCLSTHLATREKNPLENRKTSSVRGNRVATQSSNARTAGRILHLLA